MEGSKSSSEHLGREEKHWRLDDVVEDVEHSREEGEARMLVPLLLQTDDHLLQILGSDFARAVERDHLEGGRRRRD